jgi:hypothetical protein
MARARSDDLRTASANLTLGELSPRLHARADIQQYQAGLAMCRNFIPSVLGSVRNRPGTRFIDHVGQENQRPRLIPFRFSAGAGQAYVLVFEHLTMRVLMDGAYVLSGGSPYQIATPYEADQLPELAWTQSADVMTLTHPNYAPRQLSRTAHDAWSLAAISFAPSLAAPDASDWSVATFGAGSASTTHTYVLTFETAGGEESLQASAKAISWSTTLSAAVAVRVTLNALPSGAVRANVYKKRSGIFGWLGSIDAVGGELDDIGLSPDLDDTPPKAGNPFTGGNNPRAVAYYQQRLAMAGSDAQPETLWMSQAGAFLNFSTSEPLKDSDAITATLVGQSVDVIRHLVPSRSLLIFGRAGVWTLERGDQGLTPALEGGINPQLAEGSSLLPPLQAGRDVLYVEEGGRTVRAVDYDVARDGIVAEEVSLLAEHLLRASPAADWCWQAVPDKLVWLVREDGRLLSLSFLRDQRVLGWAWHDTGTHDRFEAVASIPEAGGDAVYLCVRRWLGGQWRRCLERLAARDVEDVRDAWHLDCALRLDSPVTITAIDLTAGYVDLTAPGHGLAEGDWLDLSGIEGLDGLNGRRLVAGAPLTADTLRLHVGGADTDSGSDEALAATELTGTWLEGGVVRQAVSTVSGLDHLEGESVSVLADGSVEGPYTVEAGAISLLRPASRVLVGLPFTATVRTLPLASAASAEARARRKRLVSLQVHVVGSRGVWAGPALDRLEEHVARSADDLLGDPTALTTGMIELTVPSTWNEHGQVYVSAPDALPCEILAISPAFEVGSD